MGTANAVRLAGADAESSPEVGVYGSDANISLNLIAKGTGTVNVGNSGTATATAGAATLHTQRGIITSDALTTAAGEIYTLTLTNNKVSANSIVLVSVQNGTNSQGELIVERVTPGAGSVVIRSKNAHASQAFNGTIKVSFVVL